MSFMIYKDSLSRMYGAPGSGKSFVALDLALSLAAGRFWGGRRLKAQRVIYVMAEGQAVNGDRMEAWMSKNNVSLEQLDGQFFAVPDAVMLTEIGVKQLVDWVAENQPVLVVLDTKNAMMVGEENSASDFAVMRRALDMIRKAAGCCVLLVDHTGYEGSRARGSSAGTAAMDTEIRVTKDDERPALITAEVTRDKAAEAGLTYAWRLVPEHPAAALVPTDVPDGSGPTTGPPDWSTDDRALPIPIEQAELGKLLHDDVRALARYARMTAGQNGVSRADTFSALKIVRGKDIGRSLPACRDGIRRAWDWLTEKGYLESVHDDPTPNQKRSGPSYWNIP